MTHINLARAPLQRRLPLVAALLACLGLTGPSPLPAAAGEKAATGERVTVSATTQALNPEQPDLERVGRLAFRGGLSLSSPDQRFGGLSGLVISPDGRQLRAVSDSGWLISGELSYDDSGRPRGLNEVRVAPLIGLKGRPLRHHKFDSDAESLALTGDGALLVSFERKHRILRYSPEALATGGPPTLLAPPPNLKRGVNHGIEALTQLPDGRLLALSEGLAGNPEIDGAVAGWLWDGRAWQGFDYIGHDLLVPVAADTLPSGDVLIVERRFSLLGGLHVRLVIAPQQAFQPGATVKGEEIAFFKAPLNIDNFEAVATRRNERRETLIYLLSDDNFSGLQRTLLLLFALSPDDGVKG